MIVDINKKILIVGMGLLGGSYARALKRFGFHISCITKEQSSVDYALREGIIDSGTTEIDTDMIGEADLLIFALYPHTFIEWITENRRYIKKGALVTDVTGVKRCVVYKVQELLDGIAEFIPAHPMAGREVLGVENSTDKMFIGANYIVTPTEKNTPDAIETCKEIGRLLGFANVAVLTPEEHDEMIGFLSQLTHCIAVSLMTCSDNEHLEEFTGDSFRDLTRIAKINDVMWSELFLANKDALLNQMNLFINKFNQLKETLETENVEEMRKIMRESSRRRKFFDK